jgi:hypothetical protein
MTPMLHQKILAATSTAPTRSLGPRWRRPLSACMKTDLPEPGGPSSSVVLPGCNTPFMPFRIW